MSRRIDRLDDYASIQRTLVRSIERRADERGNDIVAALARAGSPEQVAAQVRRQRDLPRDGSRDARFLHHLEHALLAVQP